MARGSITERWFASTIAAQNGETAKADEGMAYVCVDYDSDEKFSLRNAVKVLGEEIVGKELMEKYNGWPMYSKFLIMKIHCSIICIWDLKMLQE
ncbi:MAG: hypothetical protein ACLTX6_00700 [Lachnospiraceae bacterium]